MSFVRLARKLLSRTSIFEQALILAVIAAIVSVNLAVASPNGSTTQDTGPTITESSETSETSETTVDHTHTKETKTSETKTSKTHDKSPIDLVNGAYVLTLASCTILSSTIPFDIPDGTYQVTATTNSGTVVGTAVVSGGQVTLSANLLVQCAKQLSFVLGTGGVGQQPSQIPSALPSTGKGGEAAS